VALLLVLWVFMVLGVLALDFGRYMRDDASAALNSVDETRGYYLAVGGMMKALWKLQLDRESGAHPANGVDAGAANQGSPDEWGEVCDGQPKTGSIGGGNYEVRCIDQGGLVSLNKGSDIVLTKLVSALMLGPGYAVKGQDQRTVDSVAAVVDRIIDYRDPDRLKRAHGLEAEGGYVAKNDWFDSPEELLRIPGIPPELVYGTTTVEKVGLAHKAEVQLPGLKDMVSVYNRTDKIHIKTAPFMLIALLLGKDADGMAALKELHDTDLSAFANQVKAEAQIADPGLADHLTDEAPTSVLLVGRADTRYERGQASVGAIVQLSPEDTDTPKIERWFDRAPWDGALPALPGDEGSPS